MARRKRRDPIPALIAILTVSAVFVAITISEIASHALTFLFLALIPVAYRLGIRKAQNYLPRQSRTVTRLSDSRSQRPERVRLADEPEPEPPETPAGPTRNRLINDPRSGARPL